MTPRDAWRCAGWAARLAVWSKLTGWGQTEAAATARTGVMPVRGAWRMVASPRGGFALTFRFDDGTALRMVAVREYVEAGEVVFAVGDVCGCCRRMGL